MLWRWRGNFSTEPVKKTIGRIRQREGVRKIKGVRFQGRSILVQNFEEKNHFHQQVLEAHDRQKADVRKGDAAH